MTWNVSSRLKVGKRYSWFDGILRTHEWVDDGDIVEIVSLDGRNQPIEFKIIEGRNAGETGLFAFDSSCFMEIIE